MITTTEELKNWLAYDPETGVFTLAKVGTVRSWSTKKIGDIAGSVDTARGYRLLRIARKKYYAHRMAWLWCHGELPPMGIDIDHINGDRDDNRIANLRLATRSQNNHNQKRQARIKSGLKGAYLNNRGKWTSMITPPGQKRMCLGVFPSKEDAHNAYAAAARKHFGEYARSE